MQESTSSHSLNDSQKLAEEIYLDSIAYSNDFSPLSFEKLRVELERRGHKVAVGTLHNWSKRFDWKTKAQNRAKALSNSKTAKNIAPKEVVDAIKNTERTISLSSQVLCDFMEQLVRKGSDRLTLDEVELALKIQVASVGILNKPLEKPSEDTGKIKTSDILLKAKNMNDDEVIDAEVE